METGLVGIPDQAFRGHKDRNARHDLHTRDQTDNILDNLATHRNKDAAQALRDHGCWLLYLPPCSPDLNPIEQAFAKLKAHLRKMGARTFTEVFDAIGAICNLYDPTECRNYFKAAGYVAG